MQHSVSKIDLQSLVEPTVISEDGTQGTSKKFFLQRFILN